MRAANSNVKCTVLYSKLHWCFQPLGNWVLNVWCVISTTVWTVNRPILTRPAVCVSPDVHTEAVQAALAKHKERKMAVPMPSKRRSLVVQSSMDAYTPPGMERTPHYAFELFVTITSVIAHHHQSFAKYLTVADDTNSETSQTWSLNKLPGCIKKFSFFFTVSCKC